MIKKLCITFVLICGCFAGLLAKTPGVFYKSDVIAILSLNNKDSLERKLTFFFKDYFQNAPLNEIPANKALCFNLLNQYNVANKQGFEYFVDNITFGRNNELDSAITAIEKAIKATDANDHFLLYMFFNHLAAAQTEKGNSIGATVSYWNAKKELEKLNEPHLETSLDINISDLYYKNNMYSQSLFYLDKAETIIMQRHLSEPHYLTIVWYNKAENFFRMGSLDSLKVYNGKLQLHGNVSIQLFDYRKRTDYYIQLLNHHYAYAIQLIKLMQADKQYRYNLLDKQRLADAYFENGQADSAKVVINELLKEHVEANSPEIKFQLYDELAIIYENEGNIKLADSNYKLALASVKTYIANFAQVGDVSSQMKIDEIEVPYLQRAENYRRQRMILFFIAMVAILSIVLVYMFYRSVKQKRHYESLLYKAERNELAIINSHEVRKHLSNILGMIDVIHESDMPEEAFREASEYLYHSAKQLDKAIKSIADKLND